MEIRAYPGHRLERARKTLGNVFELALDQERITPDIFEEVFTLSRYTRSFEAGDHKYNGGMDSSDLLSLIVGRRVDRSTPRRYREAYWAGHSIAYLQWHFDTTFADLFSVCDLSDLLRLYHPYHEADISRLVAYFEARLHPEQTLAHYRKKAGLSQSQLSKVSGVNLRTIQAYERGALDLRNAQGTILFNLARSLHCSMEDLVH
ncbi:MAG: helix-turn-helix domain-containing protein [archaeon]|nr:helix-turn-helix domain-containing protein [archaeon]